MSLHDLIDLAKQTGDRLIVHNPMEDTDVVIMDIESYKHLVLGRRPVHQLNEKQMLDQINRDISIWRANQEQEELFAKSFALEKELSENPLPDPFEEDYAHQPEWHSAGSVIGREYKNSFSFEDFEDDDEDEGIVELKPSSRAQAEGNYGISYDEEIAPGSAIEDDFFEKDKEEGYKIQDIDWKGDADEPRPIPQSLAGEGNAWHEEPLLPEEPVFYEEPV